MYLSRVREFGIFELYLRQILLAAMAERFYPGLFTALFGDPLATNKKVIQMFDDF